MVRGSVLNSEIRRYTMLTVRLVVGFFVLSFKRRRYAELIKDKNYGDRFCVKPLPPRLELLSS